LRVAALYDVHGNRPALDAVLRDVARERVEAIVVGGDLPGPLPVLDLLRATGLALRHVRGNGERELLEPSPPRPGGPPPEVLEWQRARLTDDERAAIASLPLTETVEVDGLGRALFCHATPRSDEEILTAISPDERWRDALRDVDADVVVCGHTHVQFDRVVDGVRVVNAGSVGMPYEDEPGAYWALLGPDVELRRTPYDVEAALRAGIGIIALRCGGWSDADLKGAIAIYDHPADLLDHFDVSPFKRPLPLRAV
jgi:predicted phosphodiesterase